MLGLLVFGVAAGWVALWFYVFKYAPNRGVRVGAVLAAILIPFWDLPFGYVHFRNQCKTEGGMHVLGKITPQRAICTEASFGNSPQFFMQEGFDVVEFKMAEKMVRYTRGIGGKIEPSSVAKLVSQYCVAIKQDHKPEWNTYRRDLIVRDVESQAVVARFTSFTWQGSWLKPSGVPSEGTRCHEFNGDEFVAVIRDGTK